MKRLALILIVVLMLAGCGTSAAKKPQYETSHGYEFSDGTLVTMGQRAIEEIDSQTNPKVRMETVESKEETKDYGEYRDNLYTVTFDYDWQARKYSVDMTVHVLDKSGRYKIVRYENHGTGTKLP